MQKTLFTTAEQEEEQKAIALLQQKGYVVFKDEFFVQETKRAVDLCNLFYANLKKKLGALEFSLVSIDDAEDKKAIKRYLDKAHRLGVKKKEAIEYLDHSIKLFFEYYDSIGLTRPITSLSFLLSKNGLWIFQKVHTLHTQNIRTFENSREVEQYKEALYEVEDERFKKIQQERHESLLKEE